VKRSNARARLAPVIEDDVLVDYRDTRGLQIADGPHDASRPEITRRIIVFSDDQDSRMITSSFHEQFMQKLEVVIVVREQRSRFPDGLPQVFRVLGPGEAEIDRQ